MFINLFFFSDAADFTDKHDICKEIYPGERTESYNPDFMVK